MAFDISAKRATETADIKLKNADGTTLVDDEGNALSVTICGPASKTWERATAEFNRKRAKRVREGGGKLEAAFEEGREDEIAFLCAITVKFNGDIEHPEAKNKGDLARAIYSDDALGFIRDQVHAEAGNWQAFTRGSANG